MARAVQEDLIIPEVSWPVIQQRLQRMWTIQDAPHHSIMGQTRSGKSHLTRHGILPTCAWDRVLFIDGKGDDPTINGLGRVVSRFPSKLVRNQRKLMQDDEPGGNWFRLVTDVHFGIARDQVQEALNRAFQEGDWVVVVDELRYVTDPREPGLNLSPEWEQIVLRGGSRGVGLINLTQEPRWVRGSFYTQSSFYWFSRIEDEAAQKRVSEVGSSRALMTYLGKIPRRWWVYMDNLEDERFWALTTVTGRGM
jgi:hypothetical protein